MLRAQALPKASAKAKGKKGCRIQVSMLLAPPAHGRDPARSSAQPAVIQPSKRYQPAGMAVRRRRGCRQRRRRGQMLCHSGLGRPGRHFGLRKHLAESHPLVLGTGFHAQEADGITNDNTMSRAQASAVNGCALYKDHGTMCAVTKDDTAECGAYARNPFSGPSSWCQAASSCRRTRRRANGTHRL
jgi:hypothetical protein